VRFDSNIAEGQEELVTEANAFDVVRQNEKILDTLLEKLAVAKRQGGERIQSVRAMAIFDILTY